MNFFAENISLIILIPLWIFFIILSGVIFKLTENNKITFSLTIISTITGLIFSICTLKNAPSQIITENSFNWLSSENIYINIGTLTDSVSSVFISVFLLISLIIQIYAYGFMKNREHFNTCFLGLNLYNFSILGLILSPNIIQFLIFEILAGVSVYFFQIFFFDKEKYNKSLILNGLGDIFLFIGVIILCYFASAYMNLQQETFLSFNNIEYIQNQLLSLTHPKVYNLIIIPFVVFVIIKSVLFINNKSVNAPVQTLLNSTGAIITGIYFFLRILPLLSEFCLKFLLISGLIISVAASIFAVIKTDLREISICLSTSLTGLLLISIGCCSIPVSIIFSVVTIFTIALLGLSAGNIYTLYGTYDVNKISGIAKIDYFLYLYLLTAALSVSGIFFGGFTSKAMLLNLVKSNNNPEMLFVILFIYFINSYCIFKCLFKISEGQANIDKYNIHKAVTIAVRALCIFVILPGFLFNISKINIFGILSTIICIFAVINAYFDNKTNKPSKKFLYCTGLTAIFCLIIIYILQLTGRI